MAEVLDAQVEKQSHLGAFQVGLCRLRRSGPVLISAKATSRPRTSVPMWAASKSRAKEPVSGVRDGCGGWVGVAVSMVVSHFLRPPGCGRRWGQGEGVETHYLGILGS
ncbi:MAG: hypothetical protein CMH82_15865 [Nocardioides sp.]|nr:hypothetical protein [Nocardioides sp.]